MLRKLTPQNSFESRFGGRESRRYFLGLRKSSTGGMVQLISVPRFKFNVSSATSLTIP